MNGQKNRIFDVRCIKKCGVKIKKNNFLNC